MTPAIHELWIEIKEWFQLRIIGALIIGTQRYGKTRAIRILKNLLKNEYGNELPVFSFSKEYLKNASRSELYSNILSDFGYFQLSETGTIIKRKGRILNILMDAAINSGTMQIVLFIDDAHNLKAEDFQWIKDITDKLDNNGIYIMVLMVGQPELRGTKSNFKHNKTIQILTRFMLDEFNFFSLRDINDIRFCLEVFDDPEQLDHPRGSGVAFSQFYFPAAYQRDWRLLNEAQTMWEAFEYVRGKYHLPMDSEIPMVFFVRTVEHVLKTYQTLEDWPGLSINVWMKGVMKSNYHRAGVYYAQLDESTNYGQNPDI